MKKAMLVLAVIITLAVPAYGVNVDNRVSGNTVSYNTINLEVNRDPQMVTFNSVTKHIRLINLSSTFDCYADIRCMDSNGKRGYATEGSCNVLLPAIGRATPNTVEFEFATHNLAFKRVSENTVEGPGELPFLQVNYVVTGENQDL